MYCCICLVVGRHSRLATLLHKLADAMTTDGRTVSITEKPRPLSLTSGAVSDVEIDKVSCPYVFFITSATLLPYLLNGVIIIKM